MHHHKPYYPPLDCCRIHSWTLLQSFFFYQNKILKYIFILIHKKILFLAEKRWISYILNYKQKNLDHCCNWKITFCRNAPTRTRDFFPRVLILRSEHQRYSIFGWCVSSVVVRECASIIHAYIRISASLLLYE